MCRIWNNAESGSFFIPKVGLIKNNGGRGIKKQNPSIAVLDEFSEFLRTFSPYMIPNTLSISLSLVFFILKISPTIESDVV